MWWAKTRLLNVPGSSRVVTSFSKKLRYPEYAEQARAGHSYLRPYEGLADVWDEYADLQQPNYPAFLTGLAKSGGSPMAIDSGSRMWYTGPSCYFVLRRAAGAVSGPRLPMRRCVATTARYRHGLGCFGQSDRSR